MGAEEQLRLDVIVKVMAGQVAREQAEKILDVSKKDGEAVSGRLSEGRAVFGEARKLSESSSEPIS